MRIQTSLYLDRFGIFGGYGGSNIFIHIKVALNAVASSVWLSACCMASVIRGSTKILAAIAIPTGLKQLANAFTGDKNEPPRGKTNNVVSDQARHKPTCTVTELES